MLAQPDRVDAIRIGDQTGDERLAARGIRDAEHFYVRDAGILAQYAGDLVRMDLASGDVDEARDTAGQEEIARAIQKAEIACRYPPSTKLSSVLSGSAA
jgi:hypothetical protein